MEEEIQVKSKSGLRRFFDKLRTGKLLRVLSYFIFWSWNFIYFLFIIAVIIPEISINIYRDTIDGIIPYNFSFFVSLLILIPLVCIVLGFTSFRKKPFKLLRLFYGVEIPAGLMFLLRLFLFRQLNPGVIHLLIILFFGIVVYLYEMFKQKERESTVFDVVLLIGHTLLLIIGFYVSINLLYYIVPAIVNFVVGFISFNWLTAFFDWFVDIITNSPEIFVVVLISLVFILYSSTILIGLPFALIVLYIKSFIRQWRIYVQKYSVISAIIIVFVVVGFNFAIYLRANTQPQVKVFEKFAKQEFSLREKEQLLDDADHIREALLNAYLSPYRYISSTGESNQIATLYANTFHISSAVGYKIQNSYNLFMKPFLYQGDAMNKDQQRAENLYEAFFDIPLQRAEKEEIKDAIEATWDRDGIEAGLLNIDEKRVWTTKQELTVDQHKSWAEIEVYECYENKTYTMQEIVYHFTLPESAVITGLWLSDEKDKPKKYKYQVATRGAAQQVYKNELQRRIDPSLLEQVGPRQYRLRAFPVLPKPRNLYEKEPVEYLHLWFSYRCLLNDSNHWELPIITEKRNVYCDENTEFKMNGKVLNAGNKLWSLKSVPSSNGKRLKNGYIILNNSIKAKFRRIQETDAKLSGKLAIIIDNSFSMNSVKDYLLKEIEYLKRKKIRADVFLPDNKQLKKIDVNRLRLQDILFFGSTQPHELLKEFSNQENMQYAAIFLITDKGAYELNDNTSGITSFQNPLYMIHLNKSFPAAYPDAVLEAIQSSGGDIASSTKEALQKLRWRKQFVSENKCVEYSTKILWEFDSIPVHDAKEQTNTGLVPFAAKYYIRKQIEKQDSIGLEQMDFIHKIAKRNSIVTPYSSMIVLINDAQKKALKQAEQQADRFDREIESGKEVLTKPVNPFVVTGVPEPYEWILLTLAGLFLVFVVLKKRNIM